ncbi:hypothetical protein PVK62_13740 [Aliivibrio sp. S3MY1]|jgi:hypothetical protein|uniref:hypothetical protein n=1 Tax=Aliivibrio sp. S3MY1 TaxID=3028424 RepID=UPI0023781891|nr:hypothetical protein [Aliivibrio sp. S3MY1]MDD9196886.1 hypothetical protein [Aliivibrio sp. S3MY1]
MKLNVDFSELEKAVQQMTNTTIKGQMTMEPKKYEYTEEELKTLNSLEKAASSTALSHETQTQDWEKWMHDDDHSPKFELNYNGSPIFMDMLTLLQCLKIAEHTHHLPKINSEWWLQIIKQYPIEVNLDERIQTQN